MADRNDHRGAWGYGGDDRSRDERGRNARDRDRLGAGEQRSFRGGRGEGEHEPWRRDRYGSLHDQDRTNYGSGWDREGGGYGQGSQDRGGDRSFDRERRNWARGEDTSYGARGGHGYEPEYRQRRDEPLRMHDHDHDHEQWRNDRHHQYDRDHDVPRTRSAGTGHWQDQGRAGGTSARNYIAPETHDYGARMYNEGPDRPSGRLEFGYGGHRGGGGQYRSQRPSGDGRGFMQSSPQVRATSEGWGGRGDPEDYDRHWRDRDHDHDYDDRRGRGRWWDRDRDR